MTFDHSEGHLRAWISLKGPLKNPMKKTRYLLKGWSDYIKALIIEGPVRLWTLDREGLIRMKIE